jgi:hypothetical protein
VTHRVEAGAPAPPGLRLSAAGVDDSTIGASVQYKSRSIEHDSSMIPVDQGDDLQAVRNNSMSDVTDLYVVSFVLAGPGNRVFGFSWWCQRARQSALRSS